MAYLGVIRQWCGNCQAATPSRVHSNAATCCAVCCRCDDDDDDGDWY